MAVIWKSPMTTFYNPYGTFVKYISAIFLRTGLEWKEKIERAREISCLTQVFDREKAEATAVRFIADCT
jgi:hypothetical protein